jgi:Type IV secretion system pilin
MTGKLRPHPRGRGEPAHRRRVRPAAARPANRTLRLLRVSGVAATVAAAALLAAAGPAQAADPVEPTVTSIDQVIDNIRLWLLGILAAWATFCLTVGMIRYTSGEPGEVEKGKLALRNAAIGYAGALLAPLLVTIFGEWLT